MFHVMIKVDPSEINAFRSEFHKRISEFKGVSGIRYEFIFSDDLTESESHPETNAKDDSPTNEKSLKDSEKYEKPPRDRKHFVPGKKSQQVLYDELIRLGKRRFHRDMAGSIMEKFKYKASSASSTISRGVKEGLFVKIKRSRYSVVYPGEMATDKSGKDLSVEISSLNNGGLFGGVET